MPADTTVKVFHSGMTGAPSLSGTAGALIAVLDALLINGFGANNLDSLVIASNVATATRSAGHPFEVGSVVDISGASVSGGTINGQHRVLSRTSTTYTFATTGLADQAATGTPAHKVAAAGWDKPFSGTNLAVYRSLDVTGTRLFLRVDDTGTTSARVVGYETMSDVNTGTGPFPTAAQVGGGLYAAKSNSADASVRQWIVVADTRTIYFMPAYNSTYPTGYAFTTMFGDINSVKSPDAYACHILGGLANEGGTAPGNNNYSFEFGLNAAPTGGYLARSYSGQGSAIDAGRGYATFSQGYVPASKSGQNYTGHAPFPNPADGGIYVSPVFTFETNAADTYRGNFRGAYASPQYIPGGTLASLDRISGVAALPGRQVMAVVSATPTTMFFDVTGPW